MVIIPELKNIIEEIRVERNRNNIKSYELAKRSGISKSTLSKLENGNLNPSYDLIYRVLNALNQIISERAPALKVSSKMIRNPICIGPNDPVSKAKEIMKKRDFSQLPIIDKDNKIVGIITEKSILDNPKAKFCSEAAEFNYTIVEPDTDLEKAHQLIRNIQVILVVSNGKLEGLLTKSDFL
ncbi:MAG: CBS domain-containing protein [Caldisphaera sp.]|uniref:CBS domain-containing protein n=1 Tax=Caldisphaera sp. TaxID=2060322 RepID=UPI003D10A9F0